MPQLLTPQQLYKTYTAAEFALLPEGPPYYELINGKLVLMSSPIFEHQQILMRLLLILGGYVQKNELGTIAMAPMDVHLAEKEIYQPDLLFISKQRSNIIHDKVYGAPDLVVEILSPTTAYYDWVEKREAYARAGVREYWIIDPKRKLLEQCQLLDGELKAIANLKEDDTLNAVVLPELHIRLTEIFQPTSPT